jgi:hypothetical protein
MAGAFNFLYNKAKKINQAIEPEEPQPVKDRDHSSIRQTVSVPQYDSRTLGIDIQADIEKIKNFFRGRRLDAEGKKFVKFSSSQEIISEGGSEWLMSHHESIMNIANATTNFSDNNQILEMCEEYGDNLLEILLSMEKEWDINPAFFDMIIDTLVRNYQMFLLKSLNNLQRKLMMGANTQPQGEIAPFTA